MKLLSLSATSLLATLSLCGNQGVVATGVEGGIVETITGDLEYVPASEEARPFNGVAFPEWGLYEETQQSPEDRTEDGVVKPQNWTDYEKLQQDEEDRTTEQLVPNRKQPTYFKRTSVAGGKRGGAAGASFGKRRLRGA